MIIFLTVIHVIVCIILVAVILLQAGRGQGLTTSSFGSGNVQSIFGTRAADFLTKATSVSAICFLLTSIGLNIIEARKSRSLMELSRRGRGAPIDLNQLKKALEQVKAEADKTGTQAKLPEAGAPVSVDAAGDAVQEAAAKVEDAVAQPAAESAEATAVDAKAPLVSDVSQTAGTETNQ